MLPKAPLERLSAFSDGVFAVLITVLVLELRPPEHPTFEALLLLWPTWLSAVSYLFIAIVWTNHHYLLSFAKEATPRLIWFNFAHLLSMSLLPFSDGGKQTGAATRSVLRWRVLPRKCDLHSTDLGAGRCRRCVFTTYASSHAHPVHRHLFVIRYGGDCWAEISPCRTRHLHLLLDRLFEAQSLSRSCLGNEPSEAIQSER